MPRVGLFLSYLSMMMVLVQGPLVGWLSRRRSDGFLMVAGGLILPVGFAAFASASPASDRPSGPGNISGKRVRMVARKVIPFLQAAQQ